MLKYLNKEDLILLNDYLKDNNTCKRDLDKGGYVVLDVTNSDIAFTGKYKENSRVHYALKELGYSLPMDTVTLYGVVKDGLEYITAIGYNYKPFNVNGKECDFGEYFLSFEEVLNVCSLLDRRIIPFYRMYSMDLALDYIYGQAKCTEYILEPFSAMLKRDKNYLMYKLNGEDKNKNETEYRAENV